LFHEILGELGSFPVVIICMIKRKRMGVRLEFKKMITCNLRRSMTLRSSGTRTFAASFVLTHSQSLQLQLQLCSRGSRLKVPL
jgi:hypothetical protein